jgi:hypothetical protein
MKFRSIIVLALAVQAAGLMAAPRFTNTMWEKANVILGGSGGGTNPDYALLVSTNFNGPFTNWTKVQTNSFDSTGHFFLTNPVNPAMKQQFFALQSLPAQNDLWVPTCGIWLGAACSNGSPAAFSYHEARIGRQLDVLRIYHTPGSWTALTTTESNYISEGRRLLLSVKPSSQWSNAVGVSNGGSATVDSQMTSLAKSIAGVKPAKIMLIVWHEPENDVTGSVAGANAGTTNQYIEMWHNVRSIFNANGATNVIWCWDMEDYPPLRYLTDSLWPGNSYVDWVMWDEYQDTSTPVFTNVLANGYNWMTTNSTASNNYLSKPWGLAEWGVGINSYLPTVADQTNGINGLNTAVNNYHWFPKLNLLEYFDEGSPALLGGATGSYSNFANSPVLEQQCVH